MADADSRPAWQKAEERAQRLSDAWDAQKLLDRLDDVANQLLKEHGFDSWPRLVPVAEHIQEATGYPTFPIWSMPLATPEEARHAARLLEVLRQVRAFLYSSGSLNDAVILGTRLGVAIEQAGLADLVPLAKRAVRLSPETGGGTSEHITRPSAAQRD
jgi:hypothetical protein